MQRQDLILLEVYVTLTVEEKFLHDLQYCIFSSLNENFFVHTTGCRKVNFRKQGPEGGGE